MHAAKVMKTLFNGQLQKCIKCTSIDHEFRKVEDCSQLSLVVKGYRGLRESLWQYCSIEELTGDNQ